MKSLAGVVGEIGVANSATLFVAVICGWLPFLPEQSSWLTFVCAYTAAIALALSASSTRAASSILLTIVGFFRLATFVGVVATNGLPRSLGPGAPAQSGLFIFRGHVLRHWLVDAQRGCTWLVT